MPDKLSFILVTVTFFFPIRVFAGIVTSKFSLAGVTIVIFFADIKASSNAIEIWP